ncbi:hypothetical protein DVH05_028126 [Phytophthora capsici]|nr:hypothetical protein DVH05_028126 [Phytophthora capsici]
MTLNNENGPSAKVHLSREDYGLLVTYLRTLLQLMGPARRPPSQHHSRRRRRLHCNLDGFQQPTVAISPMRRLKHSPNDHPPNPRNTGFESVMSGVVSKCATRSCTSLSRGVH